MVIFSALSEERYSVHFVGFLLMITSSSSTRLSLIGIGTSVLIAITNERKVDKIDDIA